MSVPARNIQLDATGSSWKIAPLGELVDILDSKRKPITKRDRVAGPYPYYGATGVLDWVSAFLFDESLVLIGEDGAKWGAGENSAFSVAGKTWVNNHAHVLRPHRDVVLDDWLIYYLNATDLSDFISGMTVPKLNQGRLRDIPIPLPPLDVQKRIVAVLDQTFAALDRARIHAEANLADARDLLKAKLDATFKSFAGKKCRIDELFEVGSSKRVLKSEWKDSGVPFYRGREVTRLALEGQVANELFISESHYAELSARTGVPSPGDIVITAIGTIGNAYIVREGDRFYFKDASVLWMRRTSEVLSDYVRFWIRSSSFHDQLERGNGATVDTLTIGKLQGLLVPNPSSEEQKRAVEELATSEKTITQLESLYVRKLADLAALRQSLLQKAFAGELA